MKAVANAFDPHKIFLITFKIVLTMIKHKKTLTHDRQELIVRHLGFADSMAETAKRHTGAQVENELLQAAAQEGLCEAALRFDDSMGVEFETYAYFWIQKALHRCVHEYYSLGLTGGDEGDGFTTDTTDEEVIARIDRPDDYEENLEREQHIEIMRARIRRLPTAERQVLTLSMGLKELKAEPMPATKVAQKMQVSAATVRTICCNALAHLAALTEEELGGNI